MAWTCSGEEKTETGWRAVTIKKRRIAPAGCSEAEAVGEAFALQEKDALMAVKEALQGVPEPHHITNFLECHRHTDETHGLEYMYYITK